MDIASFSSALAKGLGRALQVTRSTRGFIDEGAVLDVCLNNRCFDPQVEGSRVSWLIELLIAAGAVNKFEVPILRHFSHASTTWDINQLCDFAVFYARQGVEEARSHLYQVLHDAPDQTAPWLAEEQIMQLDGLKGFLRIAELRGMEIRQGRKVWGISDLVANAEEAFGVQTVVGLLSDAASRSQGIRVFVEYVKEERRRVCSMSTETAKERIDRLRATPAESVIEAIEDAPSSTVGPPDLVGWGRNAPREALQAVASRMFEEDDPLRIARYLRVFSRTPLPEFDHRLVRLTEHADENVRWRALTALAQDSSQVVRDLALRRIAAARRDGETIALLQHNYQPNDHVMIESTLGPQDDEHKMHSFCSSLEDVFSTNRTSNCAVSMMFAYENTPCSNCREFAVLRLLEFDRLPVETREECRFDCNHDIRDLVARGDRQSR